MKSFFKLMDGMRNLASSLANAPINGMSCKASSMTGSQRPKNCCNMCMRKITSIANGGLSVLPAGAC